MGFVVLITVGGILGWLASILSRADEPRAIGLSVVLGIAGAVVAGALASNSSLLIGVSAIALLVAVLGAVLVLGGYYAFRRSRLGNDTF